METGVSTGLILHVQRLSTEDGPGIRSTVFFKKCPLSCQWCHNPESISGRPELQWLAARCIGCRSCEDACTRGCITRGADGLRIDRVRCEGCGECAEECPSSSLELLGRRVSVPALTEELLKDRAYFESSGGGVTFSGGEPLAQPGFSLCLARNLREHGISVALDTCGFAPRDVMRNILAEVDLILFDLKAIDAAAHRAFTGQSNEIILRNLLDIRSALSTDGRHPRLWIRTPLIPGATAAPGNLRAIGAFLAGHLDGALERWELCAFNNLCRGQYARLGLQWAYAEAPLMSRAELDECAAQARVSGVDPELVTVTGAARMEQSDRGVPA
jgi:pyruvate formate lyase activating enzyme